jgi:hypothetical protein
VQGEGRGGVRDRGDGRCQGQGRVQQVGVICVGICRHGWATHLSKHQGARSVLLPPPPTHTHHPRSPSASLPFTPPTQHASSGPLPPTHLRVK